MKTSAAKDPQVAQLVSLLSPTGVVGVAVLAAQPAKGSVSQVDGRPAIELTLATPAGTGSVFVATTGDPVPVRLTRAGANAPITLSYPAATTITAPAPDITA